MYTFAQRHIISLQLAVRNKVMARYDEQKTSYTFPLSDTELGHRKRKRVCVRARVKDGIIQTWSKCVSPHERREQNGIKLEQERVYFSKRKQDRGTEVSVTNATHTPLLRLLSLNRSEVRALC